MSGSVTSPAPSALTGGGPVVGRKHVTWPNYRATEPVAEFLAVLAETQSVAVDALGGEK